MDHTEAERLHGIDSGEHRPVSRNLLHALHEWGARRRRRQDADRRILAARGAVPHGLAWREAELTSRRERTLLARSVRSVVAELSPAFLPGASPLNRAALRPYASEFAAIADRIADLERPVAAAGVLGVHRILVDPDGPLYARGENTSDARIARLLGGTLAGLDPR